MKVLLAAPTVERGGGVSTYVRRIAEGVEKLGAEVDVLWRGPTSRWTAGPTADLRFSHLLARAAARDRYDVVATQGGEAVLLDPRGPGRVLTSHGDMREGWKVLPAYVPVPARQRFVTPYVTLPLYGRSIKRADVVIALHDADAARFRAERRLQNPSTVHVVPNGCGVLRADVEPVAGHILFLGNWIPRKGSLIIPEIFTIVRRANPTASLTLVGADPSVQSQFSEEDRRQVRAIGFVDPKETECILRSSDVLLLPSFMEGMPLAVLEALTFGVPTVGFDIPGTTAAVGRAGLLVAAGDVAGCAHALVRVIDDRGLRRELSQEAVARAQQLTWRATAEGTLAAYQHAAEISRAR